MRIILFNILSRIKFKIRKRKKYISKEGKVKICILYHIPIHQSVKSKTWRDGFTQGMNLLAEDFDIFWINIAVRQPASEELNQFDFILAKTGWHAPVDVYLRSLKNLKCPRGIVVSCSNPIKEDFVLFFYDIVWFQTFYYEKFISKHPRRYHAFGANLKDFQQYSWNSKTEKKYDVMSIGIFESYKRFEKLIDYPGNRKLIIGNTKTDYFKTIKDRLETAGVEIIDYSPQSELTKYLDQSKCLYMPSHINGGGERIIMEFKKSGIPIIIEEDNQKLKELLHGPNWDEHSYAEGIRRGLNDIFNLSKKSTANLLLPGKKLKTGRYSFENGNFKVRGDEFVEIGSFCAFGRNIQIITSNHDTNYPTTIGYLYNNFFDSKHPGELCNPPNRERSKGPVFIGNDVWIGDDVTILSGVTIGDGACIGTKSVITKDVEPFAIVGGVPAKMIKKRFSDETISRLLEIQWWNWSDQKIKTNKNFFMSNLNTNFPTIL